MMSEVTVNDKEQAERGRRRSTTSEAGYQNTSSPTVDVTRPRSSLWGRVEKGKAVRNSAPLQQQIFDKLPHPCERTRKTTQASLREHQVQARP